MTTSARLAFLAAAGSAALLLGALAFQYLGGLAPCKMCIWQRWPHGLALLVLPLALWRPQFMWIGMALMIIGAGIGVYHAGVEQAWWQGPTTCTSGPIGGQSAEELLNQILNTPMVRCDEIAWSMLGLSMAAWNAVFSLVLAVIWYKGSSKA